MAMWGVTSANNLTIKVWSKKFFYEMPKYSFFVSRFAGSFIDRKGMNTSEQNQFIKDGTKLDGGDNNPVHVLQELKGQKGDKVTFGLVYELDEDTGTVGNDTLEGNEQAVDTDDSYVELEQYRNAVRSQGRLDRMRSDLEFEPTAKSRLNNWAAAKIDILCKTALITSPTEIYYYDHANTRMAVTATTGTASLALGSTSKISPHIIRTLKAAAVTGRDEQRNKMVPIEHGGEEYYVLLVPSDVGVDMQENSEFQNYIKAAYAQKTGKFPLFKNCVCIVDNVIVHVYNRMPIYAAVAGTATVPWAHCSFMGAQALAIAFGVDPFIVAKSFDYGNQIGIAINFIFGVTKPSFTHPRSAFTFDNSSFSVYLTRGQYSDITLA